MHVKQTSVCAGWAVWAVACYRIDRLLGPSQCSTVPLPLYTPESAHALLQAAQEGARLESMHPASKLAMAVLIVGGDRLPEQARRVGGCVCVEMDGCVHVCRGYVYMHL